MKALFFITVTVIFISNAYGKPANREWNCYGFAANPPPPMEERGKIGNTEVCILEDECRPVSWKNWLMLGTFVKVKAYCRPNRSNRCTSNMQECADSKEISLEDIPKIKYYNTNAINCYSDAGSRAQKQEGAR